MGTQSNKSAIGARIYVTTPSATQMREINAGSGFASQSDLRANFGLGDHASADVDVYWPSGEVSTVTVAVVDRTIVVTEPGDGGGPGPGCPFVFTWDGTSFVRDNSLLAPVQADTPSLAKAAAGRPGANVVDQYVLQQPLVERDGKLQLQIREFEDEHSWIDEISLDVVDHPDGTFVDVGPDGEPMVLSGWIEPIEARTHDGTDAVALVRSRDGQAFAGRPGDALDLVYEVPGDVDVIGGAFAVQPKNPAGTGKSMAVQGVTVLALSPNAGEYVELKTLSPREHFALEPVALPESVLGQVAESAKRRLQLRLVWNTAHELDFAGLPVSVGFPFERQALALLSAEHSERGDVVGDLGAADGVFAELTPGETITLEFSGMAMLDSRRSYLLRATGHYLKLGSADDVTPPPGFALEENVPNPFNPKTTISFVLPETGPVSLGIYAVNGRLVRELVSTTLGKGRHSYVWDGTDTSGRHVSSSVYFYRLRTPFGELQEKMTLIR